MSKNRLLSRSARLSAAAVICMASLAGAGMAAAQMMDRDDLAFMRYHQAIYAAAVCRGYNFYQESAFEQDWDGQTAEAAQQAQAKLAQAIGSKTGHGLGVANQLALIEEAKADARTLIAREGCDGDNVQALLGLFDSDLAPAL